MLFTERGWVYSQKMIAVFRQRALDQLQLQLNSKNESDSQGAEINWRKFDAVRRERERAGLEQFEERNSKSAELAVLLVPEKRLYLCSLLIKKNIKMSRIFKGIITTIRTEMGQ